MSQVKQNPHAPARPPRPRSLAPLRLVDTSAVRRSGETPTPATGIAWGRRYQARLLVTDTALILVATFAAPPLGAIVIPQWIPATSLGGPVMRWLVPAVIAIAWMLTMGALHSRERRIIGAGAGEYKRVIAASSLSFGLLAISFLLLNVESTRRYFLLSLPIGLVALVGTRWLWRRWLVRERRFGHYLSRAVIVGTRDDVNYVVSRLEEVMGAAYAVVGVVLDDNLDDVTTIRTGVRVFRGLDTVAATTAELGADAVIIAGNPQSDNDFIRHLAWQLEGSAAELILASRLADIAGPRIHFRPVEGLPLIHVEIPQFEGGKHLVKRGLDVVASGLGLLVLLPLFAVLATLVRLDSKGPAFFSQQRVGRNGQTFRMLKFRSMVVDAPDIQHRLLALNEGNGVLFKLKNDPRVTRLGRVLRKYSLDELPQLWNVFVGDMSLVGPRPPLPSEVVNYEGAVHRRLYIKPGLTGMWQINGRSDLNWEDSVRLDLYYVENWSLVGDLVIIWRTFNVLLHPAGAY